MPFLSLRILHALAWGSHRVPLVPPRALPCRVQTRSIQTFGEGSVLGGPISAVDDNAVYRGACIYTVSLSHILTTRTV